MKKMFYNFFGVLMATILSVSVYASAGMYVYNSEDGEYWSADLTKLDKNAVSVWLEDGTAAGYNDPNYHEDYVDLSDVEWFGDLGYGWYDVVLCDMGSTSDSFPGDVEGNIALCIRGDSTFAIKAANALSAGAVACLVGNNVRAAEEMDENGIVTSGTYENTIMSVVSYSLPLASLSSDIAVRLVAAGADVTIAEAVTALAEVYNGATELGLDYKQSVRVFIGTETEYLKACFSDEKITEQDGLFLSRYFANWEGYTLDESAVDSADFNGDGEITGKDRLILVRHLAGWSGYEDLSVFKE